MRQIKFTYSLTRADRIHTINADDVKVVLKRLPEELWKRLTTVHFNDEGEGRHTAGYVTRSRREISICALPKRISLTSGLSISNASPETFGAIRGCQWPRLAVRRYTLYCTFLHELGHLQLIDDKRKSKRLRFAHEKLAQEFADHWRRELWSSNYDHPDPVHNAPSSEEIRMIKKNWQKSHSKFKQGLRYEKDSNYDLATEYYKHAIEMYPQHSLALARLCHILYWGERTDQAKTDALKYAQQSLRLDPSLPECNLVIAMVVSENGKLPDAEPFFQRAIDLYYNSWVPMTKYANALKKENRFEEAQALYKKAIRKNKKYQNAYFHYGRMLSHKQYPDKENSYYKAIKLFQKAIQLDPQDANAFFSRGLVYHKLGKYDEAIEDYTKAVELHPKYLSAYYNRGLVYALIGQKPKAAGDFHKCLDIEENRVEFVNKVKQKIVDLGYEPLS